MLRLPTRSASTVCTEVTCTAASVSTSVASVVTYSTFVASVVANPTSIALAPM